LVALLGLVLLLNLLSLGSDFLSLMGLGLLLVGLLLITLTMGYGPSFWRYRIGRRRSFPPDYGSHDPRPREVEQEEAMQADASDEEQEQVREYKSKEERKKDSYD
jgi:hypothetical protein